MITFLLIIIYLSFISLGLPDSILGVALPAMREEWGLPLSAGSLMTVIGASSNIISSFISGHIINKIRTGRIVFISCLLTGGALLGFSLAPSFVWILLLLIPLGFGSGGVDSALNNYVATHFKAHHMNWLHSFWGVGATLGPIIMGYTFLSQTSWKPGYRIISTVQLSLALILLLTLPIWKIIAEREGDASTRIKSTGEAKKQTLVPRIKGVWFSLFSFMFYSVIEGGIGLWGSSYLIQARGLGLESAAKWMAFFYGGIMTGRFISGFLSLRVSNIRMLSLGCMGTLAGVMILLFSKGFGSGVALSLIGLGLSPLFPAMIHQTPLKFGDEHSQILIGYQIGFASVGGAVLSPLLGVILQYTSLKLFPLYLLFFALLLSLFMVGTYGLALLFPKKLGH